MKKVKIKRIFSLALLFMFLLCGSSWAASFSFTDPAGEWWSGGSGSFSITFDWSTGPVSITAVEGELFQRGIEGDVVVSLNTDYPLLKSYFLDAGKIKDENNLAGPEIGVTDIPFFPVYPLSKVLAIGSDDFFVAWDLEENILMLFYGDPDCYTYLGLDFIGDFSSSPAGPTSITFTSDGVEAILGQQLCNAVPIPGAIWLLSSGLFGLVCIRRKSKA